MRTARAPWTMFAVVCAAFTSFGACSLTTDLDGLSSGGLPGDGGSEGGSRTDAPVVTDPDGGPLREGGTAEAGVDGGFVCPTKPIALCESFDTDESVNGWNVVATNGATAQVIASATGGQRGLLLAIPKTESGGDPIAFWTKHYDTVVSKLSFDVDMQYDQKTLNPNEYHVLFEIRLDHEPGKYQLIYLSVPGDTTNGWVIQDFPPHQPEGLDYHPIDKAISPNVPHHIHWDIAVGGKANLVVDGTTVDSHDTPSFIIPGSVNVSIGVTLSQVPTTPINVGYDNLVFTGE